MNFRTIALLEKSSETMKSGAGSIRTEFSNSRANARGKQIALSCCIDIQLFEKLTTVTFFTVMLNLG